MMKNTKLFLSVMLLTLVSCKKEFDTSQYEVVIIKKIAFQDDSHFVESYGLMDSKGTHLVELNYKKIFFVGDDYFIAQKHNSDQQYFKINNESLLFEKEFEEATTFFENGLAKVKSKDKWGFINRNGDYKIPPLYDFVGEFSEGLAAILVENKVGFINEQGKIVIEPKYDLPLDLKYHFPEYQMRMYRFSNGLCPINLLGKYGYINSEGGIEVETIYSSATAFKKEYATAAIKKNGKNIYGVIDKAGSWKVKPQFAEIYLTDDYFIGSYPQFRIKREHGRIKFRLRTEEELKEGFIKFPEDGSFSYFNYDGSKMIDQIFYDKNRRDKELNLWTYSFSENKAFVCNADSCGFKRVNPYGCVTGTCGYINRKGKYVVESKYFQPPNGSIFVNGMAVVALNDNINSYTPTHNGYNGAIIEYRPVCIIDEAGKMLIPPVFINAVIHPSGIIEVTPKEYLVQEYLLDHTFYIDYKGNYLWNGYEKK